MSVLSLIFSRSACPPSSLFLHHSFNHDATSFPTKGMVHFIEFCCGVLSRIRTTAVSVSLTLDQALSKFLPSAFCPITISFLHYFGTHLLYLGRSRLPHLSMHAQLNEANCFDTVTPLEDGSRMRGGAALPKLGRLQRQGWLKRQSRRKFVLYRKTEPVTNTGG